MFEVEFRFASRLFTSLFIVVMDENDVLFHISSLVERHSTRWDRAMERSLVRVNPQMRVKLAQAMERFKA